MINKQTIQLLHKDAVENIRNSHDDIFVNADFA